MINNIVKDVGMKIKFATYEKGIKQSELAKAIELSNGQVSRIINGKTTTDIVTIKKIADILGKTVGYFFGENVL